MADKKNPHRFVRAFDPHKLMLSDLIAARDAYHVHLANLPNVIGTALGRYRIRVRDRDHKRDFDDYKDWSRHKPDRPRTLTNSEIRPWSWPSVLVFVSEWTKRPRDRSKLD